VVLDDDTNYWWKDLASNLRTYLQRHGETSFPRYDPSTIPAPPPELWKKVQDAYIDLIKGAKKYGTPEFNQMMDFLELRNNNEKGGVDPVPTLHVLELEAAIRVLEGMNPNLGSGDMTFLTQLRFPGKLELNTTIKNLKAQMNYSEPLAAGVDPVKNNENLVKAYTTLLSPRYVNTSNVFDVADAITKYRQANPLVTPV
jgi:hypothetical protein